jgi:hypothetical protein
MFGVGDWAWPSAATLDREAAHGLRTWRVPVSYGDVASTQGALQWGGVDRLMSDLAARHIEPLVVLAGCPTWQCPAGGPPKAEPALSGWLAFVTAAVRRYGTGGSFWATHPQAPAQPVQAWQVYNEVNGTDQWPNPNPAEYATFLAATSAAIRGADPAAKVVLAGLAEKMTIWLRDYLPALYQQPGFAASFDVMAVQGYAVAPLDVAGILEETHAIMAANGDGARPLWVTEMSWATGGPEHPFVVGEDSQAANLRTSWDALIGCAPRWNLQRVYWFGWQDKPAATADGDYWGYHNGLMRLDGSEKPALAAADEYTSGAPLPAGRGDACPLDAVVPPPAPPAQIRQAVPRRGTAKHRPKARCVRAAKKASKKASKKARAKARARKRPRCAVAKKPARKRAKSRRVSARGPRH